MAPTLQFRRWDAGTLELNRTTGEVKGFIYRDLNEAAILAQIAPASGGFDVYDMTAVNVANSGPLVIGKYSTLSQARQAAVDWFTVIR